MTLTDVLLLLAAGMGAGAVNAVAGGGSLISFPALLATGLSPLDANVTNTVAIWPGYVGSTAAYRRELADQRRRLVVLGITSIVGAVVGSVILLVAPEAVFDAIVPGLIIAACALLGWQDRIKGMVERRAGRRRERQRAAGRTPANPEGMNAADGGSSVVGLHASTFAAGVYGAYFGGGLGVMLLAVLGIYVADHLQRTNGLKTALSLVINTVALAIFALFGPVSWAAVAVVAPASLAGGYLGGGIARKLSVEALRATVIAFGLVVAVALVVT